MTSVEIYHAGHNLMETRAPIRAMSFANLGGNLVRADTRAGTEGQAAILVR